MRTTPGQERSQANEQASASARARRWLNIIWGIRLGIDLIIIVTFTAVYLLIWDDEDFREIKVILSIFSSIFIAIYIWSIAEIVCIIAFFRRNRFASFALLMSSVASLFAFPLGTALSLGHFYCVGKLAYEEDGLHN